MRLMRAHVLVVLVAILVAATAAAALAATKSVGVRKSGSKYLFTPSALRIDRGDTVRWSWRGSVAHNVKGPGFQSRTAPRLTFSRRFTRRGTYPVVCTVHAALGQRMSIIVR
jgi:plastocyanin